ncbi:DnaA N-terminal domain-containing protein, partial [Piscinibacter sp.]
MPADLWQRGCEKLAAELPEQQFNTWIRPLPAADVTNDAAGGAVVTVRVPNRFKLDWIRNQYAGRIETVLSELAGKPVRLDITLAPREMPAAAQHRPAAAPAQHVSAALRVAGAVAEGAAP